MNPRPSAFSLVRGLGAALTALLLSASFASAADVAANPPAKIGLGGAVPAAPHVSEAAGLLRLGANLTDRNDFATAEIAYWQLLHGKDSTSDELAGGLLGMAHMYRKQGSGLSLTKAAAIYERFLKDHPDDERMPDALLELGRTLRELGAYRLALNRFYNVINSTLKFPAQGFDHYQRLAKTAQYEIAQTHFEAGEYADAGKYFLNVSKLDLALDDQARAHFMAAFSQERAGEHDAAVTTLKAYLSQWPNDVNVPEARYLLATTLRELGRLDESMAATLDLLRSEEGVKSAQPKLWAYWQRRTGNQVANELFQAGDVFNALSIYRGLQALSPDGVWRLPVTYQIALCYDRLGQVDQARAAYKEAAAGADPELAKMATWRLAHLDWRDNTDRQFNTILTSPSPDSHDAIGSAAPAPADLRRAAPTRPRGEPLPPAASALAGRPAA